MRTQTRVFLLVGAVAGAALPGAMTAEAQYYYPPPYGYGDGWRGWNGCPPGYTVQGGNCAPYRVLLAADGIPGTAVPPAIRCRAGTAHPIAVQSVTRVDGTATEIAPNKRLSATLSADCKERGRAPKFGRENFVLRI